MVFNGLLYLNKITYALSGHDLNVAIIFSSLQLFNVNYHLSVLGNFNLFYVRLQIIRAPLIFLPISLSALSDALVAFGRISKFLTSEDLPEPYPIDKTLPIAVQVDGDFVWETVLSTKDGQGKFAHGGSKDRQPQSKGERSLPTTAANSEKENRAEKLVEKDQETPFELKNLKLSVPRGAFVGIVGRVGSGKVSLDFGMFESRLLIILVEFGATSTDRRNASDER